MKKLYISESERIEILKKHNSKLLSEQVSTANSVGTQLVQTNYTIQDLQNALIKANISPGAADNQFGPKTMTAIEQAIGSATVAAAGTGASSGVATTTPAGAALKSPNVVSIDSKKVTAITAVGGKVTGAETTNVGGISSITEPSKNL